jgi:hypothetical protein
MVPPSIIGEVAQRGADDDVAGDERRKLKVSLTSTAVAKGARGGARRADDLDRGVMTTRTRRRSRTRWQRRAMPTVTWSGYRFISTTTGFGGGGIGKVVQPGRATGRRQWRASGDGDRRPARPEEYERLDVSTVRSGISSTPRLQACAGGDDALAAAVASRSPPDVLGIEHLGASLGIRGG